MTSLRTTSLDDPVRTPHGRPYRWALWGSAAGVFGALSNLLLSPDQRVSPDDRRLGAVVVDRLRSGDYRMAAVAGVAAATCLLVVASGWRRWSRDHGDHLALEVLPSALAASAAALFIGAGVRGGLGVYLPGGMDAGAYPREGLYPLFLLNDLIPYMSWIRVAIAAGACSWLGFRHRLLPRWFAAVAVFGWLPPLGFLVATGLSGFAGVVGPLWLAGASTAFALRRPRD